MSIASVASSSFWEKFESHDEKVVFAFDSVLLTAWLILRALCVLLMLLKRDVSLTFLWFSSKNSTTQLHNFIFKIRHVDDVVLAWERMACWKVVKRAGIGITWRACDLLRKPILIVVRLPPHLHEVFIEALEVTLVVSVVSSPQHRREITFKLLPDPTVGPVAVSSRILNPFKYEFKESQIFGWQRQAFLHLRVDEVDGLMRHCD